MEPVCNSAFNDARECLFRSKMKLRLCKNELDYFEECYHDPLAFAKFQALATVTQRQDKDFHINITKGDFTN